MTAAPPSPILTEAQMATLAAAGIERTAGVGDVLYRAGDRDFPFMAIIEGEAAIQDGRGREILRHRDSGFVGELSLLTGQSAYLTVVVTRSMRYIAVEPAALRRLMFEDGPLGDLILSAFLARREALQQTEGVGFAIVGPRSSASTRRLVDFARRNRLPYTWHEPDGSAPTHAPDELPVVRLPGGVELRNPSGAEVSRALGIGLELEPREEVDLVVVGSGPAGLGAAVYGASEGLATLVVEGTALGGQAGTSRRIENYLGFPAGISGSELAERATVQARKFGARLSVPSEARSLARRDGHYIVGLHDGSEVEARNVVIATGARYRKLDVPRLEELEGTSVYYAATSMEAQLCRGDEVAVVGGGNSAGQATVYLSQFTPRVHLLVREDDLGVNMSRYLADRIVRTPNVEILLRHEVRELVGEGTLEGLVVENLETHEGRRVDARALFVFIGADPHTDWLGDCVALDDRGYVITGSAAADGDGERLALETSVPGIFAVGDVRRGSVKRMASGVGEGAMAVRLVHERMASDGQPVPPLDL